MNLNEHCYSYHIFSFPFKWELTNKSVKTFSEKVDLEKIILPDGSQWSRMDTPSSQQDKRELYNEKNYFYQFVHETLYDSGAKDAIMHHYERKEISNGADAEYHIYLEEDKSLVLKILSISLNLYSTGVGVLNFYLLNTAYSDIGTIQKINDLGRKVYPPFIDIEGGITGTKKLGQLAHLIKITGLLEMPESLKEDFSGHREDDNWKPSKIIKTLLKDFLTQNKIKATPVIDDRMFVLCWIGNDDLAEKVKKDAEWWQSEQWYSLVFVDGSGPSCQNDEMRRDILAKSTNRRWQKYGTLYGSSRYSFVALMHNNDYTRKVFLTHCRTIYFRLVELSIVQRASILHFADEVTEISHLKNARIDRLDKYVSSLFKEYLRFVNKIYFREVSGQDQAIELYDTLQDQMRIRDHVTNLEREIQELHNYVSLLESKEQNKNLSILTLFGVLFVVPTFIIGYYGMNDFEEVNNYNRVHLFDIILLILVGSLATGILWKNRTGRVVCFMLSAFLFFLLLFITKF